MWVGPVLFSAGRRMLNFTESAPDDAANTRLSRGTKPIGSNLQSARLDRQTPEINVNFIRSGAVGEIARRPAPLRISLYD